MNNLYNVQLVLYMVRRDQIVKFVYDSTIPELIKWIVDTHVGIGFQFYSEDQPRIKFLLNVEEKSTR